MISVFSFLLGGCDIRACGRSIQRPTRALLRLFAGRVCACSLPSGGPFCAHRLCLFKRNTVRGAYRLFRFNITVYRREGALSIVARQNVNAQAIFLFLKDGVRTFCGAAGFHHVFRLVHDLSIARFRFFASNKSNNRPTQCVI